MPANPPERRSGALLRRCAWCGIGLDAGAEGVGEREDPDALVSHGLCLPCEERLLADIGIPIHRFLEALDTPVTLVGPETPALLVDVAEGGRVTAANRGALEVTRRDEPPADRPLLGEVFECANASLSGGCGRTIHCSACVIRCSIEETWASGRSLDRVPATLKPGNGDAGSTVELEISTERVGDRVLLTIHRIGPASGTGQD